MPLRLQLSHAEGRLDRMLERGERRVGPMMYRTSCPACSACIPIRIPVESFSASRSQKRAWKQNRDLRIVEGPAYIDEERLTLFNRHRLERDLSATALDARGYVAWLVHSWTDTREIAMYLDDELICVTIIDDGQDATSAVYCYYNPDYAKRSLGVFSVLLGIERCLRGGSLPATWQRSELTVRVLNLVANIHVRQPKGILALQ